MKRLTKLIRWAVVIAATAFLAIAAGNARVEADPPAAAGGNDYQQGLAEWEKGDFDAAIASLNRAIQNRPGDANLLLTRGLVYYDENDLDRAIADFSSVLARQGQHPGLVGSRRAYYEQGKLDKALDDVTHAMAGHPNAAGRRPVVDIATGKPLTPAQGREEAPKEQEGKGAAGSDDPFLSLLPNMSSPGKQTQSASQDLDAQRRAAASRVSAVNRARALARIRASQLQDQKNMQGIVTRANSHR